MKNFPQLIGPDYSFVLRIGNYGHQNMTVGMFGLGWQDENWQKSKFQKIANSDLSPFLTSGIGTDQLRIIVNFIDGSQVTVVLPQPCTIAQIEAAVLSSAGLLFQITEVSATNFLQWMLPSLSTAVTSITWVNVDTGISAVFTPSTAVVVSYNQDLVVVQSATPLLDIMYSQLNTRYRITDMAIYAVAQTQLTEPITYSYKLPNGNQKTETLSVQKDPYQFQDRFINRIQSNNWYLDTSGEIQVNSLGLGSVGTEVDGSYSGNVFTMYFTHVDLDASSAFDIGMRQKFAQQVLDLQALAKTGDRAPKYYLEFWD